MYSSQLKARIWAATNHPHPLSIAPGLADLADSGANQLAAVRDGHQLIFEQDQTQVHHRTVSLGCIHGNDTDAAAALKAPVAHRRTLAVAVFADAQDLLVGR